MNGEIDGSSSRLDARSAYSTKEGGSWPAAEEEAFKAPIRAQYEEQGHPYYATARLWDDGIIDPRDTRRILGLCLALAAEAEARALRPNTFGVARF